ALAVMFSRQMSHLAIKKICDSIKFCGRCPHPQPLKRLTKLFRFWSERIAYVLLCHSTKAEIKRTPPTNKYPKTQSADATSHYIGA
ncbi:hypothetical protein, partial [Ruminococcus sp.]|uniref:hypothetical protein n=1 Tax=Ruminococcus sp. TaxID=41978 RepID=UPI003F8131E0